MNKNERAPMVNISKQQRIFLFFVALLPINIFASEARNTPPTLVQRPASPIPVEPPSPTLTVAYPEEMVEEKLEGERTEKKRKFEQEEADEQETTSRSKRQKIEVERPQQQPAAAPVAPAAADAAQAENLFTFGNYYYQGNQGFPQDKNLAINLWQQAARLGHKQATEALENFKKQAAAPSAARAQEPTLAELEKAALAGNPRAQTELGKRYFNGIGVEKDLKKAFDLYTRAANQEFAEAQTNLGYLYRNGIGIAKDLKKAFDLYTRAADQGNALAQANLGYLYANGIGVAKDPKKAFDFYTLAADQGNALAQSNLAYFYQNGIGVEKDPKKAFDFYTRAADQGNAPAQSNLAYFYQNGIGVETNLKKAFDLFTRAANQGNAQAQAALKRFQAQVPAASSSSSSAARPQEPALAELEKAALAGNPRAQNELGRHYFHGFGVETNLKKAFDLYTRAANQEFAPAQTSLGYLYANGIGIAMDLKKAFDLYTRAADQGYAQAQFNLSMFYENGIHVEKDPKKAAELYERAANQGYGPAQAALRTLQAQVPAASSSSSSSASSAAFGSAIQEQAPAVEQQAPNKPKAKKSVAGQIAQAVLDAQKTKAATMRILQIAPKTLENLLEGQERFGTQAKVTMLFKKARTAGTLATEWKLSEETIKQLEALVDKE